MKKQKKSLTAQRNAQVVGNNSASYDDKHPENPVNLRPIHNTLVFLKRHRFDKRFERLLMSRVRRIQQCSKPNIAMYLAKIGVN